MVTKILSPMIYIRKMILQPSREIIQNQQINFYQRINETGEPGTLESERRRVRGGVSAQRLSPPSNTRGIYTGHHFYSGNFI